MTKFLTWSTPPQKGVPYGSKFGKRYIHLPLQDPQFQEILQVRYLDDCANAQGLGDCKPILSRDTVVYRKKYEFGLVSVAKFLQSVGISSMMRATKVFVM